MTNEYHVYWIRSRLRSYIGATSDPPRRLRQHNGEIKGGARRTRGRGDWEFQCVVSGFATWRQALCFEHKFQFATRRCRGDASRREKLDALLLRWRTAGLRVDDGSVVGIARARRSDD